MEDPPQQAFKLWLDSCQKADPYRGGKDFCQVFWLKFLKVWVSMITAAVSGIIVGGWLVVDTYGIDSWDFMARAEGIHSQPKSLLLFTLPCAKNQTTSLSLFKFHMLLLQYAAFLPLRSCFPCNHLQCSHSISAATSTTEGGGGEHQHFKKELGPHPAASPSSQSTVPLSVVAPIGLSLWVYTVGEIGVPSGNNQTPSLLGEESMG